MGGLLIFSLIFLVYQISNNKNKSVEGYVNVPRAIRTEVVNHRQGVAQYGNNQQQLAPPTFTVPGTFQSPTSPRFSSTGYGPYINYNMPDVKHLAADPNNPLTLARMVEPNKNIKEPFDYPTNSPSAQYQKDRTTLDDNGSETANRLPVQTMATSSGDGSEVPLVMDRFMVANLKSYKYGNADFIRGDLPIVPVLPDADPNSGTWFRPAVTPAIDLNAGALAVLGGAFNENCRQTVQLQMQDNAGTLNTFSGVAWQPPANTAVGQQLIANATVASQKSIGTTQGAPFGDWNVSTTMYP